MVVDKVGVAPRHLKGKRGTTRWVPVLPELRRALESWIGHMRRRWVITQDLPLFLSRENNTDGTARALSRHTARRIIHAAFARAGIANDGRLGTHTLRKTWAHNVYRNSSNDIMVLRAALHHSDVSITQKYLEADESAVVAAIRGCDFTRGPRRSAAPARAAGGRQSLATVGFAGNDRRGALEAVMQVCGAGSMTPDRAFLMLLHLKEDGREAVATIVAAAGEDHQGMPFIESLAPINSREQWVAWPAGNPGCADWLRSIAAQDDGIYPTLRRSLGRLFDSFVPEEFAEADVQESLVPTIVPSMTTWSMSHE